MAERNGPLGGPCGKPDQLCCISVNKIFDSARDKDCLEDLRVFLCDQAQELVDRSSAVRCKNAEVIFTNINIEEVPFNRGYFQVTIRYFFCVTLEVCICNGRSCEVRGLAAFDKKVILFGSEKNVSVFTSNPYQNSFCFDIGDLKCETEPTLPSVVIEVANPIALDTKVVERHKPFGSCCICADSIPESVSSRFDGNFSDNVGNSSVFVTIGMFSVTRMERPVQLMLPAANFCLPDKDSTPVNDGTDPCNIFGKMNFPLNEFFPYAEEQCGNQNRGCCK